MRDVLGADNSILISTGGLGGDISHDCTFLSAVTECDAVDAISVHRYASVPGQWSGSFSSWLDQTNGKKVFLEEWGIDASKYDQTSAFPSEVEDMNSAGLPSLYWQILPAGSSECPYDPSQHSGDKFGIFDNSDVDLAGPINGATVVSAAQDWTGSVY